MLQVNLDLFASFENRLGHCRFFSEFQHPEATGIDGMSYTGNPGDVCYAYPPRVLVNPFVKVRPPLQTPSSDRPIKLRNSFRTLYPKSRN